MHARVSCVWQDADGPLWVKRLPFFFCYFFGCSWASVSVSYQFFRRNEGRRPFLAPALSFPKGDVLLLLGSVAASFLCFAFYVF